MKTLKITLILFLLNTLIVNSQDLTNWQVGVYANPFLYTKFNSESSFTKDKQDLPNGFGFGVTIERNWNEQWGFKTGFENTTQNEKYFIDENSADNTKVKSIFKYYKIPLSIQYYYPLKEKLFLTFNQGIQLSILKYFKTEISSNYENHIYTSNYEENTFYLYPENNSSYFYDNNDYYYKKELFGIIGSIGLKGFLSEKFSYSTNLRYEYDFSNANNNPHYYNPNNPNQSIAHNFRIGLEIGVQYNFSIDNSRFDKRPHKG